MFSTWTNLRKKTVDTQALQRLIITDCKYFRNQNKLNRLLVNADYKTPTSDLLTATGSLSIQQLIAYQTAVMAYKINQSKKPHYLHQKLLTNKSAHDLRGRTDPLHQP